LRDQKTVSHEDYLLRVRFAKLGETLRRFLKQVKGQSPHEGRSPKNMIKPIAAGQSPRLTSGGEAVARALLNIQLTLF